MSQTLQTNPNKITKYSETPSISANLSCYIYVPMVQYTIQFEYELLPLYIIVEVLKVSLPAIYMVERHRL